MGQILEILCPKTRVSPDTQQLHESQRRHEESLRAVHAGQQQIIEAERRLRVIQQQLQQNLADDVRFF